MTISMSPTLTALVERMRRVAPFEASPFDATGEWLRLRAGPLRDYELFQKLRFQWPMLAGPALSKIALVHCRSEPHAGVWLHDLVGHGAEGIYRAGCYEIASWNQQSAPAMSSRIAHKGGSPHPPGGGNRMA